MLTQPSAESADQGVTSQLKHHLTYALYAFGRSLFALADLYCTQYNVKKKKKVNMMALIQL